MVIVFPVGDKAIDTPERKVPERESLTTPTTFPVVSTISLVQDMASNDGSKME